MCEFEAGLQQHELAIARHQKIHHLRIAVAGGDPLAHQQPQIPRQRRFGIIDRLVLANHAAQFARQIPRPRFLGRIRHDLVGLHGKRPRSPPLQQSPMREGKLVSRHHSAACNPRSAFAGFGAPTRSRRSDNDSMPPNAISTGPNQIKQHHRLVVDPHRDRAVRQRCRQARYRAGLRRAISNAASVVVALRVVKLRFDGVMVAITRPSISTLNLRHHFAVVRPLARRQTFELEAVTGDIGRRRLARIDLIFSLFQVVSQTMPISAIADAGMGEHRAPGRTRQPARSPYRGAERQPKQPRAFDDIGDARQ